MDRKILEKAIQNADFSLNSMLSAARTVATGINPCVSMFTDLINTFQVYMKESEESIEKKDKRFEELEKKVKILEEALKPVEEEKESK